MRFIVGPFAYTVRICPGPIVEDDGPCAAITIGGEILVAATSSRPSG